MYWFIAVIRSGRLNRSGVSVRLCERHLIVFRGFPRNSHDRRPRNCGEKLIYPVKMRNIVRLPQFITTAADAHEIPDKSLTIFNIETQRCGSATIFHSASALVLGNHLRLVTSSVRGNRRVLTDRAVAYTKGSTRRVTCAGMVGIVKLFAMLNFLMFLGVFPR